MLDELSMRKHRKDVEITSATIPYLEVLADMTDDNNYFQRAAEEYYYLHYATDAERKAHVNAQRSLKIWSIIATVAIIGFTITAAIWRIL